MGVVGEAFVLIRPKVSEGTFAREAEQGGLARGMTHIAKVAAGVFAATFAAEKIFDFGKSAVEEAALTQKATENIRNQFKGVAKDVLAFNSDAARNFGISTSAADAFSSQIGLVGTNLGLTKRQTGDMAVGLEKLAGSIGLIKGQDPAGYFTALQSALLGNTRGLKQMGISVDTTREKQYLLSQGIIHSTKDAITPAMKAQAIYGIATEHLGKFMSEARHHSGDLANSQIKLKAEFANVKEEIGAALLPVLARAAAWFADHLPAAIELTKRAIHAVSPTIKTIADAIFKYVGEAVSYVRDHWPQIQAFIVPIIHNITDAVREAIGFIRDHWPQIEAIIVPVAQHSFGLVVELVQGMNDAIRAIPLDVLRPLAVFIGVLGTEWAIWTAAVKAYAAAQWLANAALVAMNAAFDISPLGLFAIAIAGIVVGLYELYTHSATAKRILTEVAHAIGGVVGSAFGWLADKALPAITDAFHAFTSTVSRLWSRWGGAIKSVVQSAFSFVARLVRDELNIAKAYINLFGDILHGRWGKIWNDVKQIVRSALTLVIDAMRGLGGRIISVLEKIPDAIWRTVYSVGRTIVNGIIHGVGSLGSALKNTVESHIKGALSSLNPFSPVEHGAQLYISNPIMTGTVKGLDPFKAKLQDTIIPPLRDVLAAAKTQGTQWARMLGSGIVLGTIVDPRESLQLNLSRTIITAVQGALNAARSHFGIKSPSSVWSAQLGQPLRDGIVHGMGGLEQMLVARVTKAAQAAQAAAGGFGGGATPTGSAATGANQRLGMQMMLAHGWPASQWGALQALWNRESGWNQYAKNPSSGAYGIPQSLPASKMASAGGDWMTNPATQIRWGLGYISGRYGSPAAAWAHELSAGWYKHGGVTGQGLRIAGEDGPELVASGSRVSSATDTRGMFDRLTAAIDQLTKRLDQMQRPSIGEFHMHTPALSGEGAAYDALNALTRKVAPV